MAGTSSRSDKANRGLSSEGTMPLPLLVKDEFPELLVKEESMTTREHTILKVNHESMKKEIGFLMEKLNFERSEKTRVQKEMRELEERFLGLKRDTILLREENSRERSRREEHEKLLEEMKAKERDDMKKMSKLTLELEKWKSRFYEMEKMVMDVAADCLEVRSMYLNEMNGVVRPCNEGTSVPRTENTCQGDVIDISDSDEDKNIQGDGRDSNKNKGLCLERSRKDGKRLRISPEINRDSVSSCKTGEGGRRISNFGFTPRPHSPSSSSTDTSSSDSDTGVPNSDARSEFRHGNLQFKKT